MSALNNIEFQHLRNILLQDKYLWKTAAIFCFDLNYRKSSLEKSYTKFIAYVVSGFVFIIFSVYHTILVAQFIYSKPILAKSAMCSWLLGIFSVILWYMMLHRKKKNYELLLKVQIMRTYIFSVTNRITRKSVISNTTVLILNACLFVFSTIGTISCLITGFDLSNTFTLGYPVSKNTAYVICWLFYVCFFWQLAGFPCLISLVLRVLYENINSLLINYYHRLISNSLQTSYFLAYYKILGILQEIVSTFSAPLFLLNIIFAFNITYYLVYFLITTDEFNVMFTEELIYSISVASFGLINITWIAADIRLNQEKIKVAFERLYEYSLYAMETDKYKLSTLDALRKRPCLDVTACNLLNMRKSHILTLYGIILTYTTLFASLDINQASDIENKNSSTHC